MAGGGRRIASVDVTVVGSGPNGLAAAVICARAGLSVQVFEAQPTLGGGARTLPDPEFSGVSHDICSAVHPLALASPFLAEFDLPARGVTLKVPEVAYANPLPGRPAAVGYHDLDRTCAELDRRRVVAASARPAGRTRRRRAQTAARRQALDSDRSDRRCRGWRGGCSSRARRHGGRCTASTPARCSLVLPRIRFRRCHRWSSAGAGLMLATLAHTVGWPIPVGGSQAIPDALIADLRAHGGTLTAGEEITEPPPGVVLFDTAPTALLSHLRRQVARAVCKGAAALPLRARRGQGRLRAVGRDSVDGPATGRCADAAHGRHPRADGARRARGRRGSPRGMADGARRAAAPGRPEPHRRAGPPPAVDVRARAVGFARRPDRARHKDFRALRAGLPRHRGGGPQRARGTAGRAQRQPRRRRHRRRRQHAVSRAGRADAAAQPVEHTDSQGVPVLVGHTAGRRRARHVRLLRRAHGADAASSASRSCRNLSP